MNQIDQIKEILFSNEKRALDALTRRLEKRESRVADIADVLPESLGRSNAEGERLGKALRAPVEKCIKDSIKQDPNAFADALFPVIGPAIRKSISEALKTFSESINRTIEEKTSVKSIKWRMQAKRAGIPYSQFLLQKNLQYRIDHVYLIQPTSGLLIADVHRPDAIRKDDEAVSAMLTAIQDFVSESFGAGDEGILETADIGKYTLWTMPGPHAMLACVINGVPPRGLRDELTENLERIHLQYSETLEHFDGTKNKKTKLIEPELLDCLLQQEKEEDIAVEKKKLGIAGLIAFLLLTGLAWWIWQMVQINKDSTQLISTIEQEPGIFLTQQDIRKGKIHLKGLVDNSATPPIVLAQQLGLDAEKLDLQFTPFHSLEKPIVLRRIESKLSIPDGVTYSLNDKGELFFDGAINPEFKEYAQAELSGFLGIQSLEFGEIFYTDELILDSAINLLQPLENVDMQVKDGVLTVAGIVPLEWQNSLEEKRKKIPGLSGLNTSDLQLLELLSVKSIQAKYDKHVVKFVWRTRLLEGQEVILAPLANELISYSESLLKLGLEPEIILTGYTDKVGSVEKNRNLQTERALYIKGRLVGLGVKSNWIFVRAENISQLPQGVNPEERKVVISLNADLSKYN